MIEIDDHDLQRAANMLQAFPGAVDRLSKRAVRSSVKGVKREAAQKITERYTFQKKRIAGALRVSYRGTGAVFSARGRVNDLAYFKHNPSRVPAKRPPKGKYLYSEVVRGQGGTIAHAFLARMKTGHIGVFHRTGKPSKSDEKKEEIKKNFAPSVPQMLGSPTIRDYMEKHLQTRLAGAVEREVDQFLMRYRS